MSEQKKKLIVLKGKREEEEERQKENKQNNLKKTIKPSEYELINNIYEIKNLDIYTCDMIRKGEKENGFYHKVKKLIKLDKYDISLIEQHLYDLENCGMLNLRYGYKENILLNTETVSDRLSSFLKVFQRIFIRFYSKNSLPPSMLAELEDIIENIVAFIEDQKLTENTVENRMFSIFIEINDEYLIIIFHIEKKNEKNIMEINSLIEEDRFSIFIVRLCVNEQKVLNPVIYDTVTKSLEHINTTKYSNNLDKIIFYTQLSQQIKSILMKSNKKY